MSKLRSLVPIGLVVSVCFVAVGILHLPQLKAEWHFRMGHLAFEQAAFDAAATHITEAMALEPWGGSERVASYRPMTAQSYLAIGRDEDALAQYRLLVRSGGGDAKAHFALGLEAVAKKDWDAAISNFVDASLQEGSCAVCELLLKKARAAKKATADIAEAQATQEQALTEMRAPVLCLAYLGAMTAGSAISNGAMHPQLVALVQKAGATRKVSKWAVDQLERRLGNLLPAVKLMTSDVCPRLTSNDSIAYVLEWAELVPFGADTHRASIAAVQAWELSKRTFDYGQGFKAERDALQIVSEVVEGHGAYRAALRKASQAPSFLTQPLAQISLPAPAIRGMVEATQDFLNPWKWFSR